MVFGDQRHGFHHLLALDALVDVDRQFLAGVGVDDGKRPQAPAVEQRVEDKINLPHLVRRRRCWLTDAVGSADVAPRLLEPKA